MPTIAVLCVCKKTRVQSSLSNENNMVRTLSSACRLQHWDPGSPSSRVPAFLLARSKINLLRLADASDARG